MGAANNDGADVEAEVRRAMGATLGARPVASRAMQRKVRLGRGFRRVWAAAAISNLGDGLVLAALPLLAESLTKSAVLVSGIVTMRYAAWLVLGLFGGVVADRADRRWVMIVVDVGRAAVVAAIGIG